MNATIFTVLLTALMAPPAKTSNERSTRIYVRTTPPGASIILDGKELGTSDGLFLVPPGVRKITLEMDGYDPAAKSIDVREGWITRVEVKLVQKRSGSEDSADASIPATRAGIDTFHFDRILHDIDEGHGGDALDLDSGKLYDIPKEIAQQGQAQLARWFEERGVDLVVDHASNRWALGLASPALILVPADDVDLLKLGKVPQIPQVLKQREERLRDVEMVRSGDFVSFLLLEDRKPPIAFAFRTAAGTEGFLQIGELNDSAPKSMRLRWTLTPRYAQPLTAAVPKPAGKTSAGSAETLSFVRWVIQDEDTMSFEGKPVTSDELPSLLKKVPNPGQTVLEVGYAPEISIKLHNELMGKAAGYAQQFGFKYASDIGEQGLGSKGSRSQLAATTTSGPHEEAPRGGVWSARATRIYDDGSKAPCMVDLDTGKLFSRPTAEEAKGMSAEKWMASMGIDAGCETNPAAPGLWGMEMIVVPVSNEAWSKRTVESIESELRNGKPGSPAIMSTLGGLPRTFFFATREGGKGILQITARTKDEKGEGFDVVYLLIVKHKKLQEARAQMANIETAIECYQLDTGKSLPQKEGLQALLQRPDDLDHPEDWNGPYLKTPDGSIPVDPWGNAYEYIALDTKEEAPRRVVSRGPDGKLNTPDDVSPPASPKPSVSSTIPPSTLEFRIAANEEEAEAFKKSGKNLGWYVTAEDESKDLVTRKSDGQTQVLLWQLPEKSMTAGESGERKWRVISVNALAEPNKPPRLGVVFDKEGGRRLRQLTEENLNRRLAVLIDNRVVCCPTIRSPIGERMEITGNFTREELTRLSVALQTGMKNDQMKPSIPTVPSPE